MQHRPMAILELLQKQIHQQYIVNEQLASLINYHVAVWRHGSP